MADDWDAAEEVDDWGDDKGTKESAGGDEDWGNEENEDNTKNKEKNKNKNKNKEEQEEQDPFVQIENTFYEAQDLEKEDPKQAKILFEKCVRLMQSRKENLTLQTLPWLFEALEKLTLLNFQQNQLNEMKDNFEQLIKESLKAEKRPALEGHSAHVFDGILSGDDRVENRSKAAELLLTLCENEKNLFGMWFYGAKKLAWSYIDHKNFAGAKKIYERARKTAVDALNPDLNLSLTNPNDVNHILRDLDLCSLDIEILREEKEEKDSEQVCYRAEKLLECAKQGRFVSSITGRVLGTIGFNLGHFRSQARQWNASKEAYALAVSGYAEHAAEKELLESLKRYALCDLLNGALVSPFHHQQYRAYAEKKEIKLFADLRRAHEEGDMEQYGKLLNAPNNKAYLSSDPFISKVITLEALSKITAPKLPDDLRIYYKKVDPEKTKDSSCSICMDEFNAENGAGYALPNCSGHYFHKPCINDWISRNKKCPICGKFYGKVIGTMPPGNMNISKASSSLSGHPNCGHYALTFSFAGGVQTEEHPHPGVHYGGDARTAYIPDTEEGRQVLELFKRGWDQKILFRIGYSDTRCVDDVIIYNGIHMKSAHSGAHGYPDPTYLTRVKEEFATKGIIPE